MLFLRVDPAHPEDGSVLWEMQTDPNTARVKGPPRRIAVKMDWIRDITVCLLYTSPSPRD